MRNKRDTLLGKIIKKDYNNELEEVLSKKDFEEDAKNLLLDILYKIENSYNDYEEVKVNVLPKERYIQNIINIVKNNCDSIKILKQKGNEDTNEQDFFIDFEHKKIECYPIERKLLYAIGKIQKSEDIIKVEEELLNKTLTNLINVGNNINLVEPLRDFNGFSWNISVSEIEDINYNLIYQDMILLVGNEFLEEWTNKNECIIDYMMLFQNELEKKYNVKISKEIIKLLKELSILLEIKINNQVKKEMQIRMMEVEEEIAEMDDKKAYIDNISQKKKKMEKEIRRIDLLLNDKKLLKTEYEEKNKRLPIDKRIFSTRVFAKTMKDERKKILNDLEEYNKLMNPSNFRKKREKLHKEFDYLVLASIEDVDNEIKEKINELQKEVLRTFKIKILNCKTKNELMRVIYEFRYFYLIPMAEEDNIGKNLGLSRMINSVIKDFLTKSNELKLFNNIFYEDASNVEFFKNMFSLQIISLRDIYFKIFKENDDFYLQFFDENIEDQKIKINTNSDNIKIKTKRKTKLFI